MVVSGPILAQEDACSGGCRSGALCALGGVGVVAATWAWFFPPARPGTFLILGDTPRPPAEGRTPLHSPEGTRLRGEKHGPRQKRSTWKAKAFLYIGISSGARHPPWASRSGTESRPYRDRGRAGCGVNPAAFRVGGVVRDGRRRRCRCNMGVVPACGGQAFPPCLRQAGSPALEKSQKIGGTPPLRRAGLEPRQRGFLRQRRTGPSCGGQVLCTPPC